VSRGAGKKGKSSQKVASNTATLLASTEAEAAAAAEHATNRLS